MARRLRHARACAALVASLALGSAGCQRGKLGTDAGSGAPPDAGDGGSDGAVALASEAGAPADDAIPQPFPEQLAARARHLLEAIGQDDAQLAGDIVFPRDGWLASRDAADPGRDWDKRLLSPFRRAVHALSRRHHEYAHAQSVTLELGHSMVQETPRKHGWQRPLWTVKDSRVTFVVDGRTRTLPIREMTAWRGAWYVTRLR
jgi:hypothetical protein